MTQDEQNEMLSTAMADLGEVAKRFAGYTVDYRPLQVQGVRGWPKPWRVRLVTNKNERSSYRITRYGDSLWGAVTDVLVRVAVLDRGVEQ